MTSGVESTAVIGHLLHMARSRSKNKTLAVGESVHARVAEIQAALGLKNHDETLKVLLDNYCSNSEPLVRK